MCPMSLSDRSRRAGAVALLLGTVALGTSAHARAAAPVASPGDRIASALRSSPVYVADSYRSKMSRAQERTLERHIEKTGLPLKVVLMPFTDGTGEGSDAWNGSPEQLAGILHDALAQGDHEFIVLTNSSWDDGSLEGYEWPDEERYEARYAAWAVDELDAMEKKGYPQRFSRAVDLTAEGDGMRVYEKARTKDDDSAAPGTADGKDSGLPAPVPYLAGAGAVLVLGVAGLLWWRARRAAGLPAVLTQSVFAAARRENERALRKRVREEVVHLGEDVAGYTGPAGDAAADGTDASGDALRRALDAYEAAATVSDAAAGVPDLAGALALVAEGRAALRAAGKRGPRAARRREPLPLCFFHPLHGGAVRRVRWRPLGQRDALDVAACGRCAEAVRAHRPPEVLRDTDGDREVPYFQVPAERSLWAATGYGSLIAEPLAARVQRGDFTRAAHRRDRT